MSFVAIQHGNNKAYCRDNEISWVAWSRRNQDLFRFVRGMLSLRRSSAVLRSEAFYNAREIDWFDPAGRSPDWLDARVKYVDCRLHGQEQRDLCLLFNRANAFTLPCAGGHESRDCAQDT